MEKLFRILRDEASENAGGGAPAPETPEAPGVVTELTPAELELVQLKEENARLKAQPVPQPAQSQAQRPPTSSELESYSDTQWAEIESRTGKDKATIIRDYKDFELSSHQNAIDAKTNTTEAIQDALEANPKLLKLRGAIKEYMEDIPVNDRLDPAKVKRHMEKAVNYAKGKHMSIVPDTPANTPRVKTDRQPAPNSGDGEDGGEDTLLQGEVKSDTYVGDNGLRITTGNIKKDLWKRIQHKSRDPNGVRIPSDFDKPPVFK